MGYYRSGFDVVGVDHEPQPHYPFEFIQADALEFMRMQINALPNAGAFLRTVDAIHASPPCQAFSSLRHLSNKQYPDLIVPTRELLQQVGLPWIIENVDGAPLGSGGQLIMLCGTMFGLRTPDGRAEIRRHRLFELSGFEILLRPPCHHGGYGGESLSVTGNAMGPGNRRRVITVSGDKPNSANTPRQVLSIGNTPQTNVVRNTIRETFSVDDARAAMGIDWMPMKSLSQAIPPAYTEFIGQELRRHLARSAHPPASCSPSSC